VDRVEDGDHRPSHPAKPSVIDEVVHPGPLGTELCQQLRLLRAGEDAVLQQAALSNSLLVTTVVLAVPDSDFFSPFRLPSTVTVFKVSVFGVS
jgi:hypothetical protein